MAKYLVIVESPTKAKTIAKFLGRNYRIKASMGHLIDLPKSQLGIDIDQGFKAKYITIRGKGKILNELKTASHKADRTFLAADPDREGEAICWHLSQALGLDDTPCRVEFNEITRAAVQKAFKNPRRIDANRVEAQQARRILDRLVGYRISPLLWRKIRKGLSAGRVQSAALRLIADREREIAAFVPEEYWSITALLENKAGAAFSAAFYGDQQRRIHLASQAEVEEIINALDGAVFTVKEIKKRERKRNPAPPFTTSTLQQEAAKKLGFTAKKSMRLAQELYEGIALDGGETVGLITYMRTDSVRVAPSAHAEATAFIKEKFGEDYLPAKQPVFRAKKGAQEAHESIRPTAAARLPDKIKKYLSRDQYRLYNLIWSRFIASRMAPEISERVTAHIEAGPYTFRARGSRVIFPGFLAVYDDGEQGRRDDRLPPLDSGQVLQLLKLESEQHFTQPPPRYSEASLVKTMEEKGIGRPSTYAPTIDTILSRGYVLREDKVFKATDLGMIVVSLLTEFFPEILDIEFTAQLESSLDEVEEGRLPSREVLENFYATFAGRLAVAEKEMQEVALQDEVTDELCPHCGQNLVVKMGRFGKFLACPAYPECRYTKAIARDTGVDCPFGDGTLVERRTKKGRRFYGCTNYPRCSFVVWNEPLPEKCPRCGSLMTLKGGRRGGVKICSNKECRMEEPLSVKEKV